MSDNAKLFLDMCANALQINEYLDIYIYISVKYILTPHGSHKNKLNCCCRVENAMFFASLSPENCRTLKLFLIKA